MVDPGDFQYKLPPNVLEFSFGICCCILLWSVNTVQLCSVWLFNNEAHSTLKLSWTNCRYSFKYLHSVWYQQFGLLLLLLFFFFPPHCDTWDSKRFDCCFPGLSHHLTVGETMLLGNARGYGAVSVLHNRIEQISAQFKHSSYFQCLLGSKQSNMWTFLKLWFTITGSHWPVMVMHCRREASFIFQNESFNTRQMLNNRTS